ncbi:glycosyltransferase family 4 protein [Leifsonia sp. Root112D2]|uniref:glycosyltransferase family 4 protein n=1 Tax=Leifsonia sp. Root112D2 TaxID=1736426 RepID=UPI0006F4D54E|nr:glycosyltransferase family 4 protein [Leifsonia sp. Root112D2]KQV06133.1 hypothetical protein ASC63_01185 [Leifsonia sp. Root112D2]
MGNGKPSILLGVTADMSLRLMQGFPEYLVEHGWDVHVVSSAGAGIDALKGSTGITTHAIMMAREPSPFRDLVSLAQWTKLLRHVRPDVISVGTPKAGLLGGLAARLASVPQRIYLLRGLRLETSTGVRRKIFSAVERIAIASAHHVVAVSPSLRTRAIELGLVTAQKISVLGAGSSNGVDVDMFDRANFAEADRVALRRRLGLVDGVPVVGFVGRLTEDKGLRVLAEAREILARADVDHQLLVVGGLDDESGRVALDGDDESLRPAVITGHVSDPETYYQVMDLLCLPTYREGFPNVVLEAGASGIPTVTTTATGAIDSVVDGETGLLVDVGSAKTLAEALSTLVLDVAKRSSMGNAAQTRTRESYSRGTVWAHTEAYYSSLIARPDQHSRGVV